MKTTTKFVTFAALLASALLALAAGPCVEERDLENGLGHFRVSISQITGATGGDGTIEDPYDFPDNDVTFRFNVAAYDKRGQIMDGQGGRMSYDGNAVVMAHPGLNLSVSRVPYELMPRLEFAAGKVEGAEISVAALYGRAVIGVKEVEVLEKEAVQGQLMQLPQYETVGSHASGVSHNIYFDKPTLHNIQYSDRVFEQLDIDYSNLFRNFVEIDCRIDEPGVNLPDDDHGKLVVTGIFNAGFFVTDLAGVDDGYNHLYVYSYSYPENLEVGDRLDRLVGTSQDFSGSTQISFPAWGRAADQNHDPEPFRVVDLDAAVPPAMLTRAMCEEDSSASSSHLCGHSKQNWIMENLESARIRLENLRTPDYYANCDYNSDGEIAFEGSEDNCRDACLKRGTTIVVKEYLASEDALTGQGSIAANPCLNHNDCPSGQCGGHPGGYCEGDEDCSPYESCTMIGSSRHCVQDDGMCRTVCPWEAAIDGIRPNCVELDTASQFICSELSGLRQWGQWVVGLDNGSGPLLNLITQETLVNFDPTLPEHLGMTIEYLQGNLQQKRAARPRWVVMAGLGEADSPPIMRP